MLLKRLLAAKALITFVVVEVVCRRVQMLLEGLIGAKVAIARDAFRSYPERFLRCRGRAAEG